MENVILTLRRLGMRLLEELLKDDDSPQPSLKIIISKQESQLLADSYFWKLKKKRKTGRISSNLNNQLTRTLKKMTKRAIKGKLSPGQWQVGFYNRIWSAFGGLPGNIIPHRLWPAAAQAAWKDLHFQLSVSRKIFHWFHENRVIAPFQWPQVQLSAQTFSVLICFADIKPLTVRYWFSRKERKYIRGQRKFKQEAHRLAMDQEWAGFWDQWIIHRASQRWPAAFSKLDPRLRQTLQDLPLMTAVPFPRTKPYKRRFSDGLRSFIEACFNRFDRVRTFKPNKKEHPKSPLFNFTDPAWVDQVPLFFPISIEKKSQDADDIII